MSLKRILKLLAAFFTGQGVSIVTQLLVPPFFLHRYAHGVEVYGEWVVLTAAVSYLSTLNSGIQTYANNQMAIHYNGGELEEAKTVQASALKLSLTLIAVVAVGGSMVLLMPVGRWLHLRYTSSLTASLTVFLLMLQLMTNWLFSFLCNSYMALGRAHRGQNWGSAQRLAAILAMSAFLWFRATFPVLALTQLASMVLFTVVVAADMRVTAPVLLPSLRFGNRKTMLAIIKPSAYFGLYSASGFLVWQAPVLLIQLFLGPASVAIFSFTRVIFNSSRQILSVATYAVSQEITLLVGSRDWRALHRLYDLSERVVLFMVTTVSVGTLLMCPVAFSVWLHRRNLYDPGLCLLMTIVYALMAIKDHKSQFQWSSNQHQKLAVISMCAYLSMCGLSLIALRPFGIVGVMVLWVGAELVQVRSILRLNEKLFPPEFPVSKAPVMRAVAFLTICLALSVWPVYWSEHWSLMRITGIACAAVAILSVLSYAFFGLNGVRAAIGARFRRRCALAE
jgi:O-antigen/teichoic acid export membrane protein